MNDDARIADLESRLAFQEQSIEQLSGELARQQRDIELLQGMLRELARRVKEGLDDDRAPSGDERPPHY
jgi:SlyX protein